MVRRLGCRRSGSQSRSFRGIFPRPVHPPVHHIRRTRHEDTGDTPAACPGLVWRLPRARRGRHGDFSVSRYSSPYFCDSSVDLTNVLDLMSQRSRRLPLRVIPVSAKAVEGAGGMPALPIPIAPEASSARTGACAVSGVQLFGGAKCRAAYSPGTAAIVRERFCASSRATNSQIVLH